VVLFTDAQPGAPTTTSAARKAARVVRRKLAGAVSERPLRRDDSPY
jgi:hypothetical protein